MNPAPTDAAPKKRNRKPILILTAVGITLVIVAFVWYRFQNPVTNLRSELARVFDRPEELIELNLPPADGRYPGAVLLTPQPGQTLVMKREYRPTAIPSTTSTISIAMDGDAQAEVFNRFFGKLASNGNMAVQIDLSDLRMFETDLNATLKENLLSDASIIRAEKSGLTPRTIVRSYEALVTYTFKNRSSLAGEGWDSLKNELVKVGGKLSGGGNIMIKVETPAVIAYETVLVNYIASHLDQGNGDIRFSEYAPGKPLAREASLQNFGLATGDTTVTYCAMGNSLYESSRFFTPRMVEPSIGIIQSVLERSGARPLLKEPLPQVVTQKLMDEILDAIVAQYQDKSQLAASSLFIFYYAGHAISGPNGQLYLVMNDYDGDPARDIGEDYLHGLSREQLEQPTSPLSGSNSGQLIDLTSAIQAEYPEEIAGLYPLSAIEKKLRTINAPFVILVDACYSHQQMDQLREALSLTARGDYFGPNLNGGPDEVTRYANAIHRFGDVPYLRSSNAVVLSAAPGSIAVEVPSPRPNFFGSEFVAPLARRMYNRFESALAYSTPISYGEFLNSIVDVKPTGELRTQGITSWSDFPDVKKVEMLRKR